MGNNILETSELPSQANLLPNSPSRSFFFFFGLRIANEFEQFRVVNPQIQIYEISLVQIECEKKILLPHIERSDVVIKMEVGLKEREKKRKEERECKKRDP